jgi:hypothetical protein
LPLTITKKERFISLGKKTIVYVSSWSRSGIFQEAGLGVYEMDTRGTLSLLQISLSRLIARAISPAHPRNAAIPPTWRRGRRADGDICGQLLVPLALRVALAWSPLSSKAAKGISQAPTGMGGSPDGAAGGGDGFCFVHPSPARAAQTEPSPENATPVSAWSGRCAFSSRPPPAPRR